MCEIGCGVGIKECDCLSKWNACLFTLFIGNTVFPFMNDTMDYNSFIYACDFSDTAIGILKRNPLYNEERCKAFVYGELLKSSSHFYPLIM